MTELVMQEAPPPCPHCNEPTNVGVSVCASCRRALDVFLKVSEPVDPRLAHEATLALSPYVDRAKARQALRTGKYLAGPLLLSDAFVMADVLADHGVAHEIEPAVWGVSKSSFFRALVGVHAVALVLVIAAAGLLFAGTWNRRATASATRASVLTTFNDRDLSVGVIIGPNLVVVGPSDLKKGDQPKIGFHRSMERYAVTGLVVHADKRFRVAFVKAETGDVPALALGDSRTLTAGSPVVIVRGEKLFRSHPGSGTPSLEARVSHPKRQIGGREYIQLDVRVADSSNADLGSPVLDSSGRLVGLFVGTAKGADGLAIALPVENVFAGSKGLLEPGGGPIPDASDFIADDDVPYAERTIVSGQWLDRGEQTLRLVVLVRADEPPEPGPLRFTLSRPGHPDVTPVDAFVDRWWPDTGTYSEAIRPETRASLKKRGLPATLYRTHPRLRIPSYARRSYTLSMRDGERVVSKWNMFKNRPAD